jgi:enamine deaminase RidA (YjgF/YER057c/UK114 family)
VVDATRQAETVYEGLLEALASEGVGPEAVVTETVFLRRIRQDFEAARSARSGTGRRAPGMSSGDDLHRAASAR